MDGVLVNRTVTQMPELKQLNGFWNWTPEKEGGHTLVVRGLDTHGQAVMSNSVRLVVGPPPPVIVRMMPKAGDTLNSLAAKYNVPPLAAADANPDIDPAAPLAVNQPAMIPFSTASSLPLGWTAPPSPGLPANPPAPIPPPPSFPTPGPGDSYAPSPPKISARVNGCQIIATIKATSDNGTVFLLWKIRDGPGAKAEMSGSYGEPLGTGEEVDFKIDNAYGTYQLFAQAENGVGIVDSDPIQVQVLDGNCVSSWQNISEVKLITVEKIKRLYCYVTIDKLTYIRVPLLEDAYIDAMSPSDLDAFKNKVLKNANLSAGSGFDLTRYLPMIDPKGGGASDIKFDCSDWDSHGELGVAEKSVTDAELGKFTVISAQKFSVLGIFGAPNPGNQSYVTLLPPKNLHTTGDPKVCAQHVAPENDVPKYYDVCAGIISMGTVAFVWDGDYSKKTGLCFPGAEKWCTQVSDIDGFRLYRYVDPTGNQEVASTTYNGARQTGAFTPYPTDDQKCFTVRAYKGAIESADSNVVCLKWGQEATTGTKTVNIYPSGMEVYCENVIELGTSNAGKCSQFYYVDEKNGPLSLTMGHYYQQFNDPAEPDLVLYWIGSGIIRFNNLAGPHVIVSEVMGKPIQSASLKYQMTKSSHQIDGPYSSAPCDSSLGVMHEGFGGGSYSIIKHPVHPATWDEISVDVTDVVKGWAQGQPNFGFFLDGAHDGNSAVQVLDDCTATYNNFHLEVTYFPNK